ncbi:MAG: HAD family hydrolase [Candidatus Binatia bacterium]
MDLSRVSTVLFDLGNTIHHLDHRFIAEVISTHGVPVGGEQVAVAEYRAKAEVDAQLRARRSGSDSTRQRSYFETIMAALDVPAAQVEPIRVALHEANARDCLWRVLHDDTPAVLSALRARGYTLGIVSNADGRVLAALAASGIAEHFAAVVDSHVVGVEKPDPRIFALALEACGAAAEAALFVGDIYEIDIAGARNAGLTPVLIDPLGLYGEVDCLRIDRLGRLLELLPPSAAR